MVQKIGLVNKLDLICDLSGKAQAEAIPLHEQILDELGSLREAIRAQSKAFRDLTETVSRSYQDTAPPGLKLHKPISLPPPMRKRSKGAGLQSMTKKTHQLAIRIEPETVDLLDRIAESERRKPAGMLRSRCRRTIAGGRSLAG